MDQDWLYLLLFLFGVLAGILNVFAGGGSSITLPLLIFMGLDAGTANGTNRLAILFQNISAVASFKKEKISDFGLSLKLSLLTLPGAIAGTFLAIKINDDLFEKILGVVLIFVVLSFFIPFGKNQTKQADTKIGFLPALSMIGAGFYGGFIQVGVGFLLMAALRFLMRFDLVHVNMHKVFVVFIYTVPSMLIFIFAGKIDYISGLVLASGNALGAWWAARMTVRKGEKLIKNMLAAAIVIMAAKLLGVF